jgi:hypothetical protein
MKVSFQAELWLHEGEAPWHFVTLPREIADEIEETGGEVRRGFGAVKVSVTIGSTTWATSLFPDTKAASYVLPVKRMVREREGLAAGDTVSVSIVVVDR